MNRFWLGFILPIRILFSETQIYFAPQMGFPLAEPAKYFKTGFGGEIFLRQKSENLPIPWLSRLPIDPFLGLVFSNYGMEKYSASHIQFYELVGGAAYEIKLPYKFSLVPRLGVGGYYANFTMANRNQSVPVVNPLFYVGNSLMYLVHREIYLEFCQGYSANYVGNPTFFQRITVSLGVTLRLGLPPVTVATATPVQELQSSIINHYEQGNYDQALKEIEALEKISPEDLVIEKYRSLIFQQKKRQEAKAHLEAGRHFRAIALLKQAVDIPEAMQELKSIRESLQSQISSYLNQGISAYDRSDFDTCIAYMEKVLLIDPENPEALIYLPRAQNRRKAMQKLR